ncbi:hypothetical protein B0H16DRAFT_1889566 [Mycena metata]|uniref:BTB domain-containing protein n=1 Tax=Mycena metata TaxID=1033252 RepID=A0AAD7IJJ9_9AGAR|nr:hypothetical protein B0H16DRAFT_1889566 [Mycena metata]
MAAPQISKQFCAADSDLTVSSSDGVRFKVHRKNLEVHSPVFASAQSSTRPESGQEVVELSESSDTLELLFQFMYPQPQPDLQALEFSTFADLAEAAEKYEVYSALTLCRMRMNLKDSMSAHPLEVLLYATRHNHSDLANQSARHSMGVRVAKAMEILPLDTFKAWILFRERWNRATATILSNMLHSSNAIYSDVVRKCLVVPNPAYQYHSELSWVEVVKLEFIPTSSNYPANDSFVSTQSRRKRVS